MTMAVILLHDQTEFINDNAQSIMTMVSSATEFFRRRMDMIADHLRDNALVVLLPALLL